MKAWLKGGLIGVGITLILWIWVSISYNCLLHPASALLNPGGVSCGGWGITSITDAIFALLWALAPFVIFFLIGLVLGTLIGWLVGKRKGVKK